jgi:hypothetical protein
MLINNHKIKIKQNTTEKNKMTMTLEQIKGMNIPVGAPIEIVQGNEKRLKYFAGTDNLNDNLLVYGKMAKDSIFGQDIYLNDINPKYIDKVTILAPQK